MSIKAVHIIFIICSIILTAWFGAWAYGAYTLQQQSSDLIMAMISWALTCVLVGYIISFLKKIRHIME